MSALTVRDKEISSGLVAKQKMITSLLMGDKSKSDKFLATAVKVAGDSKLSACKVESVIDACILVAQLGLDLNPVISHAYLVPYKDSVQVIVTARGYTAIATRTGWKIKSFIVYEDDFFNYEINGFKETIIFRKNLDTAGETFKYAVAMAESPDGELYIEVMNKGQVDKIRATSQSGGKTDKWGKPTIWEQWYDQQALKTVIKRLNKKLPLGEQMMLAIQSDEAIIETVEATPTPQQIDINSMAQTKPKEEPISDAETVEQTPLEKFFNGRGMTDDEKVNFTKWANITDETVSGFLALGQGKCEEILEEFYAEKEAEINV